MSDLKHIVTDGRQLKAARVVAGLTVREIAEAAGLNRNSVLRVEASETLPYFAYAADKLAVVLQERGIIFTVVDGTVGIMFSAPSSRRRKRPLPL